jgi:hypothetical protein
MSGGDVGGGDLSNAFPVDIGTGDPSMECEAGQDRGLGCGVKAFDVGCRVGLLCITSQLCLRQCLIKTDAGGVHAIEDVIRCAVDDPDHRSDLVTDERFP